MHNVKQEYLMNFLQKDANCFLLTYFFKNDGINETDPMNQRPDCTKRALDIISELANDLIWFRLKEYLQNYLSAVLYHTYLI